jgi:hypothetical protein
MNLVRRIGMAILFLVGGALTDPSGSVHAVPFRDRGYEIAPKPVDWNATRIAFEMGGKPWSAVLAWFADQTQMPCRAKVPLPMGTLTFISPRDQWGRPREFTLTEIFDIINERLQAQENLTLLRGDTALTMVPADQEIPRHLIPRVNLHELRERGRTEIVEVVVKLPAGFDAEEFAPQANRLLGPFGAVITLGNDQLILSADVATLRRVVESLR